MIWPSESPYLKMDGWKVGRMDRRKNECGEGKMDGWMDRKKEGRKTLWPCLLWVFMYI